MILFDTDHLTVLQFHSNERRLRIIEKMAADPALQFATTIISAEEQLRGWLASIAKERDIFRQVDSYQKFGDAMRFLQSFEIVSFDETAAGHFQRLRSAKSRVSTMDLKIASIALAQDALLLTANRRDFEQAPGLRFENWMDPPKVS
ncbi:type II toxin-antitoxin system VapC family toxin [Zavarzinella formosa]|uniref:type II toxin-antitoxin system VapC family toxin n=1 Tax=Zavarzinella formosa TaxID=360055 RepID=UPI0002EF22FC|nr:type II toxin-antitoxin system VapC family toxin [Zavarzinella formosa]